MIMSNCLDVCSLIKAFTFIAALRTYCAADHPQIALTDLVQSTAIQEMEKELVDTRRMAELYTLATGRSSEDAATKYFAEYVNGQIHLDRIQIKADGVFIDDGCQPAFGIQLAVEDFKNLFSFFTGREIGPILERRVYPAEYVLKLLSAATYILRNPFSTTPEMILFRRNLGIALKAARSTDFITFNEAQDISGVTKASLRTILDIYADMHEKLRYFANATYSFDDQDDSLVVYNAEVAYESRLFAVFLHLVRLCKITELNIRCCTFLQPLSAEAQDALARCQITRLVPPSSEIHCRNIFLLPDSDAEIQSRIWHRLAEVGWFSRRGDWLQVYSFNDIFAMSETRFCQNLVRPAVRPEDFSTLEMLSICAPLFPADMVEHLEKAVKMKVLLVINCRDIPDFYFMKKMTNLEALWLLNINFLEFPEGLSAILPSLDKFSTLVISNTLLMELPPEVGQLKELKKLVLTSNSFLTTIPDTLSNCSKLSFLDLGKNKIRSLPNILGSLDYLNISYNFNPEILSAVTNYTCLTTLKAEHNFISTLPADFGNLKNLHTLNLSYNNFCSISFENDRLPFLKKLYLINNYLSTLPPSMANFKFLRILFLSRNQFRGLPGFVKEMRERNSLLLLHLSGNPFQNDDTSEQLGLRTLWDVFGDFAMPEYEYRWIVSANDKPRRNAFCPKQNGKSLRWNLENLRHIRLAVPPHPALPRTFLESTLKKILANPLLGANNNLVYRRKLNQLIRVLYSPELNELRGNKISKSNKIIIKSYLSEVIRNILKRVRQRDTDRAAAMLIQLNDSLGNCPSGQMGALMEIYRLHCLEQDPDDFRSYVREFIAREKEDRFTGTVALPNHRQNVHLVMYWKKQLKDDLGLVLEYEDPYGRIGEDRFKDDKTAVLSAFFDRFSPDNVIKALAERINGEGKVGEASKYLNDLGLLPVELRGEYFVLAEDVEEAAENFYFNEVKEAGVKRVLVAMDLLLQVTN